jgi:hypothetical protein
MSATSTPTPPADPAQAAALLADTAGHAANVLFEYRCDHPDAPDLADIRAREQALEAQAIALRQKAIVLLGTQAADALAQMQHAAHDVEAFFDDVAKIESRLAVAAAVVSLAAAAQAGDVGGVLGAVAGVHDALKIAKA